MIRKRAWPNPLRSTLSPLSLILVAASLYVVALGLKDVTRGAESSLLIFIILLGLVSGLVLAALCIPGWSSGIIAGALGALLIMTKVGRIGPQLWAVVSNALALVGEAWSRPSAIEAQLERTMALSQSWIELRVATAIPLGRVYQWLVDWASGEPHFDPVAVALLWSGLFWCVSVWAGCVINARRQPLTALAPAIALLGAGMGSVGAEPPALLWSLGIVLPTMALVAHDVRADRWRREGIRYARRIRGRLVLWAMLIAGLLVSTAALSYGFSIQKVVRYVDRLTSEREAQSELARQALGLEQQRQAAPIPPVDLIRMHTPGLPQRQLIGAGPELSEQLALVVRLPEAPRGPSFEAGVPVERYYWRSTTYDRYTKRGWGTESTEPSQYPAGTTIIDQVPEGYRQVDQIVRTVPELGGLLFHAGDLVTVDQPFTVDWRSHRDAFGAVLTTPRTSSRIQSLVLYVDTDRMRGSQPTYPDWIRERYLEVPEAVPDRVMALARELTATSPTPYDRAMAIERYLRTFEYTLELPEPPTERDIVDYFLFDLQRGYCDYFASAMVILARAAGLPSRLAVGYAGGQYDPDLEAFLVTEAEAHSWPEIYFSGLGWLEFEPTSNRPELQRTPLGPVAPDSGSPGQSEEESLGDRDGVGIFAWEGRLNPLRRIGAVVLVGLVFLGLLWRSIKTWRRRRLPEDQLVARLFSELKRKAASLDFLVERGATPNEVAAAVASGLASPLIIRSALKPGIEESRMLVDRYIGLSYRIYLDESITRATLIRSWNRLTWRLRLAGAGRALKRAARR